MKPILCMNCGVTSEPSQEYDGGVVWRCGNPECRDDSDRDGMGSPQRAKVYPDQDGAAPAKQAPQKIADVIPIRAQRSEPQTQQKITAVTSQPQEPPTLDQMVSGMRARLAFVNQQIEERVGYERERDNLLAILTRFPEPATSAVVPDDAPVQENKTA